MEVIKWEPLVMAEKRTELCESGISYVLACRVSFSSFGTTSRRLNTLLVPGENLIREQNNIKGWRANLNSMTLDAVS
jgi:hypothetical protein